ncbi:MAG: hypothetical protein DCC75_09085 [Proteobacteria bacterium]|nr:MAG: hypothetical protein DCC75_09085 [Pseudomonadota bacterium]
MKSEIQAALKEALKSRDKIKLETLRGLLTAMQYEEIEKKVDQLPKEACLAIIQREIKKRNEEIDFANQAKRSDLIDKLKAEIAALDAFLPPQLASEQLTELLNGYKAKNPGMNMGVAMKTLKDSYPGQYDAKLASELAKKIFA